MNTKQINAVKSILGEDIFDELAKSEIIKLNSQTGVDPEEIKVALQIVPRAILSYLFAQLRWRQTGAVIDLELPFAPGRFHANKIGPDNYNGEIYHDNKKVCEFKYRSLPSIGLLILSSFELYNTSLLNEVKHPEEKMSGPEENKIDKLQEIIDEKLMMHRLINDVVDKRLSEREAIDKIVKDKLDSHINHINSLEEKQEEDEVMEQSKKSKLKAFLESREQRRQEDVELDKSEIKCPDCDTTIYKGENSVKLCICYGSFHNEEIKIKKSKDGSVKLKFPKKFDIDNVEMLLDSLKNK